MSDLKLIYQDTKIPIRMESNQENTTTPKNIIIVKLSHEEIGWIAILTHLIFIVVIAGIIWISYYLIKHHRNYNKNVQIKPNMGNCVTKL